jgi:hypothetical protein
MGSGGGLFIGGVGTLSLTASTLAGNTATINGGGLELQGTVTASLTNVTIAGNTALNSAAAQHGGGIDMTNFQGNVLLVNDTITNNFATVGGGLYWAGNAGSVTSQNTLIALNTAATGPDVWDVQAGVRNFTDQGNNFIGINTQTNGFANNVNGSQVGTTANPLNPMVTGLTNNGGPLVGATDNAITLETEALLPGSLAIGKGKTLGAPPVDARGFQRIGAVDIGAFQFENVTLQLTITAPATLDLNNQATVTVTVLNTSGNPLPADGSTLTLTTTDGLQIIPPPPPTVPVGAVGPGQMQNFTFTVKGTHTGNQTITATVTSPDTNPNTTSTNATVNVVQQLGSPPPTTVATSDVTTPFLESNQDVTLTADVTSDEGPVNDGTVKFTILSGGNTVIGVPQTSATVSNGHASVSYALPAGTVAGSYSIIAEYFPEADFAYSLDNSHVLTVNPASTTTTVSNATATFSASDQDVTLTANVISDAGPVFEGTVTFTVSQNGTVIGTATTSDGVHNGVASVSYVLPGGTLPGNFTIDAQYNPGPDFTASHGQGSLVVSSSSSPVGGSSSVVGSSPVVGSPSVVGSSSVGTGQTGAGILGLALEEIELVLDSALARTLEAVHLPNASLEARIDQLHTSIVSDPLFPTFGSQLAVLLDDLVMQNVLSGS